MVPFAQQQKVQKTIKQKENEFEEVASFLPSAWQKHEANNPNLRLQKSLISSPLDLIIPQSSVIHRLNTFTQYQFAEVERSWFNKIKAAVYLGLFSLK